MTDQIVLDSSSFFVVLWGITHLFLTRSVVETTPGVQRYQVIQTGPSTLGVRLEVVPEAERSQVWEATVTRLLVFLASQGSSGVVIRETAEPPRRDPRSGKFRLPGRPLVLAAISFLVFGFAGIGPLLLGQEGKAILLFGVEWLVVFPVGFLSGLLPVLLLLFHAAVAVDTWMIARRLQVGQKVRKWEWCWQ